MDGKFILLCLLSLISLRMSLPVFVYCWDKQIPVWLVASLSTSLLNKTCAPHAAALCCLQIYSPFFFLADVSQFICCLLSPPAPPPQWVSLPLVSLSFLLPASSLLHLITLAFPGNRHWTKQFPLSCSNCEWLTALSTLPKRSRQHLPPSFQSVQYRQKKQKKCARARCCLCRYPPH